MKKFDVRAYSIADFLEWNDNKLLELSPDFQRRSVWSSAAKSYLIDTILRGKPMPKILIKQQLRGARNIRTVVDGQQRLRSILEFLDGSFRISRAHNRELAGRTFDALPEENQQDFLQYELGVDLLYEGSYEELLDIFARINSYTVNLNPQEKRNAKYVGYFKQYAYKYGYRYVNYFLDGGILTKQRVTRMAEAELSAELLVALVDGVQTNKNTEQFYRRYEDEPGILPDIVDKFDRIMSFIGDVYPAYELAQTNWSRVHLFYTLFTSVGHCLFGLEGLDRNIRAKLTERNVGKVRVALDNVSQTYDVVSQDPDRGPAEFREFVDYSRRRTTDTAARISRANFVCNTLKQALV